MAYRGPCQRRYVLSCPSSLRNLVYRTSPPLGIDVDYDPAKAARAERKERVAKNERQHQANLARAAAGSSALPAGDRKKQIDRTLAVTRASTASMGRFDRQLEGEKKLKGVKRKVRRRSRFTVLSRV